MSTEQPKTIFLQDVLHESIKRFEAYENNPAFKSEMEQNAVQVVLRELRDLLVYADPEITSLQNSLEALTKERDELAVEKTLLREEVRVLMRQNLSADERNRALTEALGRVMDWYAMDEHTMPTDLYQSITKLTLEGGTTNS